MFIFKVRLSPEELASQELAQWRDKEAKHQLELIKKSELDLLAASKTYVLKTHKGEEVIIIFKVLFLASHMILNFFLYFIGNGN